MTHRFLLAVAMAAAFCTACDPDGGGDDDDGDNGSDHPDYLASDCTDWFPGDVAGHSWTYAYDDGLSTGTWVWNSMGPDTFEGTPAYRIDSTLEAESFGMPVAMTLSSWYTCDAEGMRPLAELSETTAAGISGIREMRYEEPPLAYPADVVVGDQWTARYFGTETTAQGDQPFDWTTTFEVLRDETVTVPTGTYDTRVVEITVEGQSHEDYYAKGVGLVKGLNMELVDIR